MDERRTNVRRRVLKAGTIAFGQAAGIDCTVRNVSETGACLEVVSPIGIPDQFTLVVPHDAVMRQVQVKWRRANRIGVVFA